MTVAYFICSNARGIKRATQLDCFSKGVTSASIERMVEKIDGELVEGVTVIFDPKYSPGDAQNIMSRYAEENGLCLKVITLSCDFITIQQTIYVAPRRLSSGMNMIVKITADELGRKMYKREGNIRRKIVIDKIKPFVAP